MLKAQKLKGFQDIHGEAMGVKRHLVRAIREKARLANFVTVDTPCLEYTETLLGEGGETDKQIFRFTDNGGRDVALRYDLTVPFARFVAENYGKLPMPFKRFQMGKAWRAEKPQKGRYREFSQADFDIVGVNNVLADVEILSIFFDLFSKDVKLPFTLQIGYRGVVSCVIKKIYGELESEKEQRLLINLDKLAKIGKEKVCELMAEETETKKEQAELLLKVLQHSKDYSLQIKELREFLKGDTHSEEELCRLEETLNILSICCQSDLGKFQLDLSIVRGLAYYTGIVFETVLEDFKDYGSVCSGGRYDNLCGRFLKESPSGIGGSFGVDRLVAALLSSDKKFEEEEQKTIMIALASEGARDYAFLILKILRENKLSSEIYLKEQKLAQQFKYASRMNYPFVLTVGDEEKQKKTFNLKNMREEKETRDIPIEKLISELKI
jgi:histidyl-tRNA synthetase